MNKSNIYDSIFYKKVRSYSYIDGKIILPYILEWYDPKSVADIGCAEGTWLAIIKDLDDNIEIAGFDGNYIDKNKLEIDYRNFTAVDLDYIRDVGRRFDLVISTEVAEHLRPESSEQFIELLTSASDNVLFSAAIPGQGGDNHINEKWQSYWEQMFVTRGFIPDYSVRDFFWNDTKITNWRRQNIMFYTRNPMKINKPAGSIQLTDVIHPDFFEELRQSERENEELLNYIIANPHIYRTIEKNIGEIVKGTTKIAIAPYGNNGKICKKILNLKYGIQEIALLDNKKYSRGSFYIPIKMLAELPNDIVVLDTCSNECVHEEILGEIKKYVSLSRIVSIFPKA